MITIKNRIIVIYNFIWPNIFIKIFKEKILPEVMNSKIIKLLIITFIIYYTIEFNRKLLN